METLLCKYFETKRGFVEKILAAPIIAEKRDELVSELKNLNPKRPIIFVGAGTCGLGAGAGEVIEKAKEYIKEKNFDAEVVEVACIGFCAMEPIMDIKLQGKNRISFKHVKGKDVETIIDSVLAGTPKEEKTLFQFDEGQDSWKGVVNMHDHEYFKYQERFVLENCGIINPASLQEYVARGGYLAFSNLIENKTEEEVCDLIEKSGLRGRGGGGFPTGKKWKIAQKIKSDQKYMICNADEGDPGAFMDRAAIEGDPHKVLEGLMIASYAIGSSVAYVYIRAEYPLAIERLELAIEKLKFVGLLGENILGTNFSLDIIIKKGAGAFVCGEETALIHSIEGKRGMPRPRPPYPALKGLFGKPTIINNVETLANIPGIINLGWKEFVKKGTDGTKGTKVFALSGKVKYTGLIEVEMGQTLKDIIFKIGGGIPNNKEFKAAQIGGPSGGCIPMSHIETTVDYESLKSVGAMMGSGGLVVMDEDTCMVDVARFFMEFITRESCGKCTPCREGTKQMLNLLNNIVNDEKNIYRKASIEMLQELGQVIKDTSLCGLGQTAPNPVLSTMRWFPEEYREHVEESKCEAKVCSSMFYYYIDGSKCVGCTLCAKACPVNTIEGKVKEKHNILQENCIKCGACLDACNFEAVLKVNELPKKKRK